MSLNSPRATRKPEKSINSWGLLEEDIYHQARHAVARMSNVWRSILHQVMQSIARSLSKAMQKGLVLFTEIQSAPVHLSDAY